MIWLALSFLYLRLLRGTLAQSDKTTKLKRPFVFIWGFIAIVLTASLLSSSRESWDDNAPMRYALGIGATGVFAFGHLFFHLKLKRFGNSADAE